MAIHRLVDGELMPQGDKRLVGKMEVAGKASAQRLAEGIQETVVKGLFSLI